MSDYENASSLATMAGEVLPAARQEAATWPGLAGRFVLALLHLVSSILYWAVRLTTITIPTIIFSLLSARWTVTMNATTL
jgi:lysophospholipid hydrolase